MEHDISSGRSIQVGIGLSLLAGLAAGGLAFWALSDVNGYLASAGAAGAFAFAASALNKSGWLGYTAPGNVGLDTTNGEITNKVRGPGYQWAMPGIKGQIPLNVQESEFSPAAFTELVKDVPLDINLLCMGRAMGPKYFSAENPKERLAELAKSQARVFVSPWKNPDAIILQKSLLPEFLALPPQNEDPLGEHARFTEKLMEFTIPGAPDKPGDPPKPPDLPPAAAKAIMLSAGKLVKKAYDWDFQPTVIEVEDFGIPEALKDLAVKDLVNAKRVSMVKALMADNSGILPHDALDAVNMLLELPVSKTIQDIQIRDLEKISNQFGKGVAELLVRIVNAFREEK
jgi:hypothetical protein